jgi:ferredoxin-NADP reductase
MVGFRRLRVANLVAESASVTSLYLTTENGGHLPEPRAGQYITLRAVEAGDPPPVRSYSLSSTSRDTDCYRISIKRESQGMVSAYLHTQLGPGSILEVAVPRGQFVLIDEPTPGANEVTMRRHSRGERPDYRCEWALVRIGRHSGLWSYSSRVPRIGAFRDLE